MSTNPLAQTETIIKLSKKSVDRSIRTLMAEMEHENTLLAESNGGRVQRLRKVYRNVKPLLGVLVSLPLIPHNWRAALGILIQVLDSLATSDVPSDVTADFKAGRDL